MTSVWISCISELRCAKLSKVHTKMLISSWCRTTIVIHVASIRDILNVQVVQSMAACPHQLLVSELTVICWISEESGKANQQRMVALPVIVQPIQCLDKVVWAVIWGTVVRWIHWRQAKSAKVANRKSVSNTTNSIWTALRKQLKWCANSTNPQVSCVLTCRIGLMVVSNLMVKLLSAHQAYPKFICRERLRWATICTLRMP